jgi:hypothetical protein
MNGVGRRSIMADGSLMNIMAGYGYQVMNGRLPGFAGAQAVIIMDGRHWAHSLASMSISLSAVIIHHQTTGVLLTGNTLLHRAYMIIA